MESIPQEKSFEFPKPSSSQSVPGNDENLMEINDIAPSVDAVQDVSTFQANSCNVLQSEDVPTCINIDEDSVENDKFENDANRCEEDVEVIFDNNYQSVSLEITQQVSVTNQPEETESAGNNIFETIDVEDDKVVNTENEVTNDSVMCEEDVEVVYDTNCESSSYEVDYDLNHIPLQITGSWKEFKSSKRNNFTRGCKWAPDGSCILTCSDDNILRLFNLPQELWDPSKWEDISEMDAVVKISEGDLIYDYCWYPLMNSNDPTSCCLASASRKSTVHLWDGFTGELRCSYRTFNHMDEIVTPHSLSFDADGQRLFCGFKNIVRIFDVATPGRRFSERHIFGKGEGQSGIISCFAFTPTDKNISAAGSYQKTIGIYSEPSGELECLLEGQKNGITQLQFSPDGTYLYSGGRKDPEILCWDVRNLGTVLFSLRRSCITNQRMYFDISRCGRYVVSGNQNGVLTFWDVTKQPKVINEDDFPVLEPTQFYLAHDDCVNGVSFHPTMPLLCSSSGQRKFPVLLEDETDENMFSNDAIRCDNSLRLWWAGKSNS